MKPTRPDLAALGVVALIVVGVVACSIARVPIPEFLPQLGLFIAGGGLGVALNTGPKNLPPAGTPGPPLEAPPAGNPPAAPLAAAALPPQRPAAWSAYDTGVIPRIASGDH